MQCDQIDDPVVLIPSSKLQGDLPPGLVDGHVHWLNPSANLIEIRPLDRLWEESSKHWRIDLASGSYHMYRGQETLVDIRSPTWAMFSKCFECLDARPSDEHRNLIITTSPFNSASIPQLFVALPHYSLSFFVNEMEELESRDFKQMVYDEDQCAGTLIGLENILILRPTRILVPRTLIPRCVLVPSGKPIMHGDHQVQIDSPNSSSDAPPDAGPLYHTYLVDTELGCLAGNGGLASTEFLARLHAMTSWHRPDSLTGKTGAQAALCLLQSHGCWSIMKLKLEALGNSDSWIQYPQIKAAYEEIRSGWYGDRASFWRKEISAAQRAAYLFPSNASGPASLPDHNDNGCDHLTTSAPSEPGLPQTTLSQTLSSPRYLSIEGSSTQITLNYLMCNRPAPTLAARIRLLRNSGTSSSDDISALDQIFSHFKTSHSFHQKYLTQLDASAQHVRAGSRMIHARAVENLIESLREHYSQCRLAYLDSLEILKKSLAPMTALYGQTGQWPLITAGILLRYLASTLPIEIPLSWKKCLTSLALLLLDLQRSRRLLRFALDGLEEDFSKEWENEGCDGWNPEEYPDWLLIQVGFFCPSP